MAYVTDIVFWLVSVFMNPIQKVTIQGPYYEVLRHNKENEDTYSFQPNPPYPHALWSSLDRALKKPKLHPCGHIDIPGIYHGT